MTVRAFYSVFCDKCPEWIGQERLRSEAMADARAAGWKVSARKHLCPDCAADR